MRQILPNFYHLPLVAMWRMLRKYGYFDQPDKPKPDV